MGLDPAADKRAAKDNRRKAEAEKKAAANRTVSAYLSGDYAQHLATARSGQATLERVAKAWGPILERDMAARSCYRRGAGAVVPGGVYSWNTYQP